MINIPSIKRKKLAGAVSLNEAREAVEDILIEYDTGFTEVKEERSHGECSFLKLMIQFKIKNNDKKN